MPYIGKQPLTGAYQLCDTITTSATATYNLLVGGSAVIPGAAQNCIVSLNGVVQAPVSAYTVSGSQITFASTLSATDVIDFILILGNVFDIGKPTDGSVTNASVSASAAIAYSKLNLGTSIVNADIASAAAIATTKLGAGAVLQVVQTFKSDSFNASSSTTYTDITGLSVSITPSSASNKILVLCTVGFSTTGDGLLQLLRGSTAIGVSTVGAGADNGYAFLSTSIAASLPLCINFLDSPNTTSSTTYKIQGRVFSGAQSFSVNRRTGDTIFGGSSTITAMEIAG